MKQIYFEDDSTEVSHTSNDRYIIMDMGDAKTHETVRQFPLVAGDYDAYILIDGTYSWYGNKFEFSVV